MSKPYKNILVKQYITLGMSLSMLSYIYEKDREVIRDWLISFNIPVRDKRNNFNNYKTTIDAR